MILSGQEILKRLGSDIIIEPFDRSRLNPNSYNLRLDDHLLVYDEPVLDMSKPCRTREIRIPETGLVLEPGKLYLGKTVEYTQTHRLVPMLEGRSSVGRLGICIHVTAGFGDAGFKGCWTLELFCIQPVVIYPFVEICQIYYHEIEGEIEEYTSGKYQDSRTILPSRLYTEFTAGADKSGEP